MTLIRFSNISINFRFPKISVECYVKLKQVPINHILCVSVNICTLKMNSVLQSRDRENNFSCRNVTDTT